MAEPLLVRASSLPSYMDCPRRGAARTFRKAITERGFELAPGLPSIGSVIGTSLHKGAAHILRTKKETGTFDRNTISDAIELCDTHISSELAKETAINWDKTTTRQDSALKQLRAMFEAYIPFFDRIEPMIIEQRFEHKISPLGGDAPVILLSGELDVMDVHGEITDHKTGASFPSPHAQLGAYSILLKLNELMVNNVRVNWVPRKGIKSLDDIQCVSRRLDIDQCEQYAWRVLKQIQSDYINFLETGDPWSFAANPTSQMCTPKYCSAHTSGWCKVGKQVGGYDD